MEKYDQSFVSMQLKAFEYMTVSEGYYEISERDQGPCRGRGVSECRNILLIQNMSFFILKLRHT